jgi:hypothetical protein
MFSPYSSADVLAVLRKCKTLATCLGSPEFAKWVDCEINGYLSDEELPDYRRLSVMYDCLQSA